MKRIFFLTGTLLFATVAVAQSNRSTDGDGASVSNDISLSATGNNAYGSSTTFYNPPRPIEGSVHLWDTWKNTAVIHTSDEQKFLLKNINLNLKRNTFESQIEDDQIFTFNFNNIDRFVVNNKVYKNFYWDDDNKVYQVIYENDAYQILKGFNLTLVEGSANPMLGRKNDRYVKKEHYYIRQEGKIKSFKLKKSKILKLVGGDDAKADMLEEYAKRNDLSFKKENDVQKILDYSAKN